MIIGKKWQIQSNSLNIILSRKRKRIRKDTKKVYEDWEIVGYFATVANALHELVNQSVRDTELKDLKTISRRIDELHILIDGLPTTSATTSVLASNGGHKHSPP